MATWGCGSCGGRNPDGTRFCGHCGDPAGTEARPEERRLVTALFADISGFTPLARRLDPEQLVEVVDPLMRSLAEVVDRYGGRVEKYAGDAVLALFGAPTAHEDDAARALEAALELHRATAEVSGRLDLGVPLSLHAGVCSGHAIARTIDAGGRRDYAVLGDVVILAQRLESAAPPGETYVGQLTCQLAGDAFELEALGPLELKGIAGPVPAWRLRGRRRRPPQPADAAPLVGRDRELGALEAALGRAGAGEGGLVVVTGEAGIGKSALIATVRARARGVRWLEGRCRPYAADPYQPYAELLDDLRGDHAAAELLEAPAVAPFAAALLGARPPDMEPDAFRRGLHLAVGGLLRGLARLAPVVVAVEDAHWLDPSSRALTGEIARAAEGERVLLVLTTRARADRVAEDLPGRVRADVIELGPLDAGAIGDLVSRLFDRRPPAAFADAVVARSGGNPLFVEALVRAVSDLDGEGRADPAAVVGALPPTIEGLLANRLDRVPGAAAAVLQAAAVIGGRVPPSLLRAVEPGADEAAIAGLVERGFLVRDGTGAGTVEFRHALVQDAVYARLLRRERRRLHQRVAEEAERLFGRGDDAVGLLAHHGYLGAADAPALDHLLRAAGVARRVHAAADAAGHLERAAELAGRIDPARVPGIELELAEVLELQGDYARALVLYERGAVAGGDPRAWRGVAGTRRKRGDYAAALVALDDAFAARPAGRVAASLWLERGRTYLAAARFEAARDALQSGLAALDDPASDGGELLVNLAHVELCTGDLDAALACGLAAREALERAGDRRALAMARRVLGGVHEVRGDLDAAARSLRDGLADAEAVGHVEEIGGCLINLGLVELARGDLAAAVDCDRRAIEEFERVGHGLGRAAGHANLAEKLVLARDVEGARHHCRVALDLAEAQGDRFIAADARCTEAAILRVDGHPAAAAAAAEVAAAQFRAAGAGPRAAAALELAAEAWDEAGDPRRAGDCRQRARDASG